MSDERRDGADGDGPPDPALDPTTSPGFEDDVEGLEDIEVGRDVTIGEATPRELTVGDTAPVEAAETGRLVAELREGDAVERRRAAIELADRDLTAAAVDALVDRVQNDADADVRQFAVEAIGEGAGGTSVDGAPEEALAAVRDALEDPDPWVRSEAVVALDALAPHDHADVLEGALGDDHHAVRRNALVSLFKHRGEDALPELLALADDEAARVREWVAHMLGGVDDERAARALAGLAEDGNDVVAKTALAAAEADPEQFRAQFGVDGAAGATGTAPESTAFDEPPDL